MRPPILLIVATFCLAISWVIWMLLPIQAKPDELMGPPESARDPYAFHYKDPDPYNPYTYHKTGKVTIRGGINVEGPSGGVGGKVTIIGGTRKQGCR
jgi:hypothetical protein